LTGESHSLARHERVDGAIVNKDFQKSVKDASGSDKTYPEVIRVETEELFDCTVEELYAGTNSRKGNRASLPKEAQTAYIANEIRATHELNAASSSYSHDPDERHGQTVEQVKETSKQTRKWLPW
jgi:hypothetical protein